MASLYLRGFTQVTFHVIPNAHGTGNKNRYNWQVREAEKGQEKKYLYTTILMQKCETRTLL